MRKECVLLFFVFTFLFAPLIFAQQKQIKEPVTKLERFLSKKGKLIIRESYEVGILSGQYGTKIIVDALIIYEPGKEADKIRGLKIEVHEGGRLERSDIAFLDIDEVESLSQAISYMIDLLDRWKGKHREYIEVIFLTKDDFKLGFYQKGAQVQAFSTSGITGKVSCFFPTSKLLKFKAFIDKGNSLLTQ